MLVLLFASTARATVIVETAPEQSRLVAMAEALRDRTLEGASTGAVVFRVESELPDATRPEELIAALLAPSLEAFRARGRVEVATFEGEGESAARAAARLRYGMLVEVSIRARGNFLDIEAARWDTRPPRARGSVALRTRLDVELRQFVGALPHLTNERVRARALDLPSRGYLASAVHDLDGDGRAELVLLTERTVSVLRVSGATALEVARASIGADVPLAPTMPHRAIATAVPDEVSVVARTTRHAAPIRIELAQGVLRVTRADGPCDDDRFPIGGGCAQLVPGRDFFHDRLLVPGFGERAVGHFYARASRRVRLPDGTVVAYAATITPAGRLALRVGDRAVAAVGYGTALAISDLDDDGTAELLASSAAAPGAGDQLSLLRAHPRGALHVVWRSEALPGSVWIATSGDVDSDGRDEFLAVEEPAQGRTARLWIVR